ncbi:tRNA-specific 2-thiouridylase MnmA [Thalassocella blandensis]|nr:tRNA-specific 2-thiouridylase MnmA [Thalassocella blandensis]
MVNSSNDKQSSQHNPPKVIVGMSGGVDSSVSALLLQQQGYHVEGLFMKNWNEDDGTEYCTAVKDLLDAAAVCQKLGIHLHTANFAAQYWDNVFEHFLLEYKAGRTPNPDILCNREIKFKVFLEYAESLGADFIATGHYTRTTTRDGHTYLCKGLDPNKDQSYFLHAVSEKEFAKTLFPIGDMEKTEVRRIAEKHDLVTHNKKDSTGICFIGERRFKDFLENYLPAQPGNIVTDTGDVIGSHQGLMYHTIGQRQGLGIGGVPGAKEEPWYVAEKDLDTNQLVVVQGGQHPLLFKNSLIAGQVHWINNQPIQNKMHCKAKTRYRQADQDCIIYFDDTAPDTINVVFNKPQRAITPGQSVVFYQDDICLGGAVIEKASNIPAEQITDNKTVTSS